MPERKKRRGKKGSKAEKKPLPHPEQTKSSLEEEIEAYIGTYIDSYMDFVEDLNLNEADFPFFYTRYPFHVTGYILPDNSTCILFRGLADATTIDVKNADFEPVDKEIEGRDYEHICCYPPNQLYAREEAETQGRKDAERDIETITHLKLKDADRTTKDDVLKSVRVLSVAVPWVSERRTAQVGSGDFKQAGAIKLAPENLKMEESEDFSSYLERLKDLEKSYLQPSTEELKSDIKPTEAAPSPKPAYTPPPAQPQPQPQPKPPAEKETQAPINVPLPPSIAQPGANISIEIKQPEATGKADTYEGKRDIELLRLKKTVYNHARELEELKQLKQTVFRMNRKVHDTELRTARVENSNREMIRRMEESHKEQMEESKKARRFITEKAKKARNQAMTLAVIAIVISLISLPILVMLLLRFWGEIKGMLGL